MNERKILKKIKRDLGNDLTCDSTEINDGFRDEERELSRLRPKGIIIGTSLYIDDFLGKKFPHNPMILDPWLRQGTLALLYSEKGLGKTWFSLSVAIAVTRGLPIGAWKTITPVGCFYFDGEMPCEEMQSRLRQLTIGLPPGQAPLHIISSEDLRFNNKTAINIADEKCRNNILDDLRQDRIFKLIIFDNYSCLAPGINENSKKGNDAINQWLLELRRIGVAVIMVHHTGKKEGTPRGTSAREDNIDVSISLKKVKDDSSFRGAMFEGTFTKGRSLCGDQKAPFVMRIAEGYAGKLPWEICSKD